MIATVSPDSTTYCLACQGIVALRHASYDRAILHGGRQVGTVMNAALVCGHQKRIVTGVANAARLTGAAWS